MPSKKKFIYLITTTSATALLTLQLSSLSTTNPNHYTETIKSGFDGVARSSRAVYTIGSSIVDYKYSLHGVVAGSDEYLRKISEVHQRSANRILKLCETNKGFYVKAGQFVGAMRQVPKEYSSTLSSLQDKAVPCQFRAIKEALSNNLGQDISDLCLSFDEKPIAAASIAQVHRATLNNNQEVAIKVQYPGLEDQMKIDMKTMSFLSDSITWIFPEYRFGWLVSEFTNAISLELDFVQEAKNAERTAINFRNNNMVKVPRVLWDLSTSRVLTMEFCNGNKVDDLEFLKRFGINPVKVAKALVEVLAEMIFIHGFVHGDPHPGNIFVSPDGQSGFSLVLLDHGIYKELDEGFRLDYCKMWKAMILQDYAEVELLCNRFGVGKYSRYFPLFFTGRTLDSKSTLGRGLTGDEAKLVKQDLKSLKMEDISSFMESLPPDFLTILRTDGLLRSILRKLGAPLRVRLLVYAKFAVYGLSVKLNHGSGLIIWSRLKGTVDYMQLRLVLGFMELLSQMNDLGRSLVYKFKKVLGKIHFLIL